MRRGADFLGVAGLFLGGALLQWIWASHFGLWGLSPQILLILTIAAAAHRGSVTAMTLGFFWGLFLDLMGAHLFGANALVFVLVAYGVGLIRRQMDVAGLASQVVLVILCTWGYFVSTGLLSMIFARSFFWIGWPAFFCLPLYNSMVAVAAHPFWTPRRRMR